jgi:hypothetical protein
MEGVQDRKERHPLVGSKSKKVSDLSFSLRQLNIAYLQVHLGYGIRGETQVKLPTSCGNKIERLAIREGGDL